MSDQMMWNLVRQRQAEGVSDEQIERELKALGVSAANIETLLAEPPPNWDAALFWVQLSPLVLVPLISLILAVALPRAQLAYGLVVVGFLTYMLASLALLAMAFMESILWGLALMFLPCAPLAFVVLHIDRTWKLALTYVLGFAMCIGATFLEPNVLEQVFGPGRGR